MGAAVLAQQKGYDVFVTDMGAIKPRYKEMLDAHGIAWEEGGHTEALVLKNVPGPLFCTDYDNPFVLNVASEDFMKLTGYTRDELFIRYGGDLTNSIP